MTSIRKYVESDFSSISEIYALCKLDELKYEDKEFEFIALADDRKRLDRLNKSDVYVYEDNNIIAYVAYCDDEITALFVHPDHRRKGIAKQLLEFILAKTPAAVNLNVARSNWPAKTLYSRYGFKDVCEFETSYNGVTVIANTMERCGEYN